MAKKSKNKNKTYTTSKTNMGNLAMVYLPLIGWIPAAIFMLTETDHKLRWHAMQALLLSGLGVVLLLVSLGSLLGVVVGVLILVMQVVLTMRVRNGELMRLPVLADLADNIVKKI